MNDLVKLERPTADEEAACLDDIRQQLVTKRGANGKLTVLANIANLETVLRRHPVVSRMLLKFPGGVLWACEGSVSQAARSRGMGSRG